MAWVTKFETYDATGRMQPSQVVARVKAFSLPDAGLILQIDTAGSEHRVNPGKQSQTLQLGKEAAGQLFEILKETYDFK